MKIGKNIKLTNKVKFKYFFLFNHKKKIPKKIIITGNIYLLEPPKTISSNKINKTKKAKNWCFLISGNLIMIIIKSTDGRKPPSANDPRVSLVNPRE